MTTKRGGPPPAPTEERPRITAGRYHRRLPTARVHAARVLADRAQASLLGLLRELRVVRARRRA